MKDHGCVYPNTLRHYYSVADLYKITAFCPVTVTRVMKKDEACVRQSNAADFITVTMKDQFVSR